MFLFTPMYMALKCPSVAHAMYNNNLSHHAILVTAQPTQFVKLSSIMQNSHTNKILLLNVSQFVSRSLLKVFWKRSTSQTPNTLLTFSSLNYWKQEAEVMFSASWMFLAKCVLLIYKSARKLRLVAMLILLFENINFIHKSNSCFCPILAFYPLF